MTCSAWRRKSKRGMWERRSSFGRADSLVRRLIGLLPRPGSEHEGFLGRLFMDELSGDSSSGKNEDPIRDGKHLRKFGRDEKNRETLIREPVHDLENLSLGADIDATSRL